VERVGEGVPDGPWWGDVVGEPADRDGLAAHLELLPVSEDIHEDVSSELLGEELRDEEEVRDKSRLKDDGDVARVEELDLIPRRPVAPDPSVLNVDVDLEALEEDDNEEDEGGRDDVVDVGKPRPLEGIL